MNCKPKSHRKARPVKAWALINRGGSLVEDYQGYFLIDKKKDELFPEKVGERVARVIIKEI